MNSAAGEDRHGLDPVLGRRAAARRTACPVSGRTWFSGEQRQVGQGGHARQGDRRIVPRAASRGTTAP